MLGFQMAVSLKRWATPNLDSCWGPKKVSTRGTMGSTVSTDLSVETVDEAV